MRRDPLIALILFPGVAARVCDAGQGRRPDEIWMAPNTAIGCWAVEAARKAGNERPQIRWSLRIFLILRSNFIRREALGVVRWSDHRAGMVNAA